jgi:hypothetical protein
MRKSIKLGTGVRLNLNPRSASLSIGGRGNRYTISGGGRKTRTIGVPGSGMSWVSTSGGGRAAGSPRRSARTHAAPPPAARPGKPGLFSPGYEKRFFDGLQAYAKGDHRKALSAFETATQADTRNCSDELFAGIAANHVGDKSKAISYLERVVQSATNFPIN